MAKDDQIIVRVDSAEKVEVAAAAKEDGFDNVSQWTRKLWRDRITSQKKKRNSAQEK